MDSSAVHSVSEDADAVHSGEGAQRMPSILLKLFSLL